MKKILIIRFSSIGDIIQCMCAVDELKVNYPEMEIQWITREDMADILTIDRKIQKIWRYNRRSGFIGLVKLFLKLKKENFTYIYDAHNNIRSSILKLFFLFSNPLLFLKRRVITRSKERIKRFFLFYFHINLFPKPFIGSFSYVKPLLKLDGFKLASIKSNKLDFLNFSEEIKQKVNSLLAPLEGKKWICIVPSAAWELKKWDVEYWIKLITIFPEFNFVIIGGPQDHFCEEIASIDRNRVINLAGITTIIESLFVVYKAEIIISGDTGFLHAADFFKKKGVAIIGPTAFGYPTNDSIKVLEIKLKCKPCSKDGRGKCKNREYKKCMREITPEKVKETIETLLC